MEENEEENAQENEPKKPTATEENGSQPKTTPLIDIANQAAERMENANKETARLQKIQSDRDTRIALGGRSEAGQTNEKPVSEEQKKQEQAAEFFKGTALGDAIKKTNG